MTDVERSSNSHSTISEEDPLLPMHREANNTSTFTVDSALNGIGIGLFQLNVFFYSGLLWTAQSLVTFQLALLAPSWQCEFQLSNAELATITMVFSLGNMLGSFPIGVLCDRYGRRNVINIATMFFVYFSLMSAFVPNYQWVIALRFILGFLGISSNQGATYSVEFMPVRYRSPSVVLSNIFWTFGSCVLVVLCYFIIPVLGWRYLVFISGLPLIVVLLYYWIVPNSPRFLMTKGRRDETLQVLEWGAKLNCRKLPVGELVSSNASQPPESGVLDGRINSSTPSDDGHEQPLVVVEAKEGGILDIFGRKYFFTTLFLGIIWFTSAFIYYGVVLITADIFTYDHHCHTSNANHSTSNNNRQAITPLCHPLKPSDYLEYIITSTAELPGILITVIVVEIIGRKLTFAIQFLSGGLFFILFLCIPHEYVVKTGCLFVIRGCIAGAFVVSFLYTGEVYPTYIRARVLSVLSMSARVSTILTSYTAQVLLRSDYLVAVSLFGGLSLFTAIISLLLPHETKGKKLE